MVGAIASTTRLAGGLFSTAAWGNAGNAPGREDNRPGLAEGHIYLVSLAFLSAAALEELPDCVEAVEVLTGLADQPFRQVLDAAWNGVSAAINAIEHDFNARLPASPNSPLDAAAIARVLVFESCQPRLFLVESVEVQPLLDGGIGR